MAKQLGYEKVYIKTLKSMDAKFLAGYMVRYIDKAEELLGEVTAVVAEIKLMQKILLQTLKKEKK